MHVATQAGSHYISVCRGCPLGDYLSAMCTVDRWHRRFNEDTSGKIAAIKHS